MAYEPKKIEKKWQEYWQTHKTFATPSLSSKPKKYILDMFPYPSGTGLHVGHPKGYTATDIVSRYYHANGYNVLHPMGFDAFGLPAENFAIKTGTHPKITTENNIQTFISQLQTLGLGYDWDRLIDTTDPEYYKWTQWIFLELFKKWLAYEQNLPINYCPSCKTGLANEEVLSDNTCERCWTLVERRAIRQWVLRITDYAERLIEDLDLLDWSESVKEMQRNWIWRSEGTEFEMRKSDDDTKKISVYTTRIDTVFGMTYAVMAPDHPSVEDFITEEQSLACHSYIEASKSKSDQDRTQDWREKTWVFTGSYVVNPFNNSLIPLWIGDYVLGHYGTGAVMAVPAHDERDFAFATKYGLDIIKVIASEEEFKKYQEVESSSDSDEEFEESEIIEAILSNNVPYTEDGIVIAASREESSEIIERILHTSSSEARTVLTDYAEKEWFGKKQVNYKLRDWLFSRQRYWGEPIPLIHLDIQDLKKIPHIYDLSEATDPNIAYLYGRNPEPGESTQWVMCPHGHVRELVINGKVYSKIYDWLSTKIVIENTLPLTLPEMDNFLPADDGNSPLARNPDFVNVRLASNLSGHRETNTMPQWGGSCWYYLRYLDPKNADVIASKEILEYWQNVDEYVGWTEHAVLHLLYARFWHKVLYDIGIVPTKEPFQKLVNQGMILAYAYQKKDWWLVANDLVKEENGKYVLIENWEEVNRIVAKMSKSLKNTANPIDIVNEYSSDVFRLYIMSIGDFRDSAPWNPEAIIGMKRFLDKVYTTFTEWKNQSSDEMKAMKLLHKTIKKVGGDIEEYKFNTAISSLNILLNEGLPTDREFQKEWKEKFAIMLHPFAPHIAEELWEILGNAHSIFEASWPEYDEFMLTDDEVTIAVQVNGKLRGTLKCFNWVAQEEVSALAYSDPNISKWIEGKMLVREIFIPNKMLSIVVKDN